MRKHVEVLFLRPRVPSRGTKDTCVARGSGNSRDNQSRVRSAEHEKVTYPVSCGVWVWDFTPRRLHGHAKPAGVGSVDLWHGDRIHYGPLGSRNRGRASDTEQSRHAGKANPTDRDPWPRLF